MEPTRSRREARGIAPDEKVAACVLMNLGSPDACKTRGEWSKRLLQLAKRGEFSPVPKE
jgi:hypothetical protein